MKILIFGRGAIGTQYAWAFEKAGHDVEFYVRPGRKEQYGAYVNLETQDGRRKKNKRISEKWPVELREEIAPNAQYDLVFLSVNTEQVKKAVEYLAPRIGNATVLFFNNFGGDAQKAVAPIPVEQVVFGFPGAGGGYEGNTLYGIMYKTVQLGLVNATPSERELAVQKLFEEAGFRISVQKDIRSWLLNHYVMNTAMEAEVLKHGSFENVVLSSGALADMIRNIKEMIPYLKAKKVPMDMAMKMFGIIPPRLFGHLLQKTMYAKGSMAYEAIAHNHFKAGYAVKEIVSDARKLGVLLPRLEAALDYAKNEKQV
ncbi:MAG: ketopantoate reductase family protein [Lachnospiraceae bacterium]|nr:ketopantoate reductase family protein [Lachnospiraceae bacterium]